ncbi:hypothetical protein [Streptomyces sp. CRN 30]|uniref:hypothetical protein n=1 Tax=Streptomyces sp. CRN 30 TaxID=3075613 RepID=UPI002A7F4456|nr:hypothetical protein [Streptomyces sp. CRN 30]
MTDQRPVTVSPPSPTGGRRVRADGEVLGLAYDVGDLVEFLRRAGLEIDAEDTATSPLIDWHGVGPEYWGPETRYRDESARQPEERDP